MATTPALTGRRTGPTVDVQRLIAQSRVRLASVQALREDHRRIAEHSRRRLDASRLLLARGRGSGRAASPVLLEQPTPDAHRG